MFSCEFCEMFKNTFYKRPPEAASGLSNQFVECLEIRAFLNISDDSNRNVLWNVYFLSLIQWSCQFRELYTIKEDKNAIMW